MWRCPLPPVFMTHAGIHVHGSPAQCRLKLYKTSNLQVDANVYKWPRMPCTWEARAGGLEITEHASPVSAADRKSRIQWGPSLWMGFDALWEGIQLSWSLALVQQGVLIGSDPACNHGNGPGDSRSRLQHSLPQPAAISPSLPPKSWSDGVRGSYEMYTVGGHRNSPHQSEH